MPEKKMSVDQFAEFSSAVTRSLPRDLSPEFVQRCITDQAMLAAALRSGLEQPMATPIVADFFTPVPAADLPERFKATGAKYRRLAAEHGVSDAVPVCFRVQAGYALKHHAPLAGPCHDKFRYLQKWNFPDEPTCDMWLFGVPCLLRDSANKTAVQQLELLAATRTALELPAHHMSGFGSVGLAAGFILAHFKATSERVPLGNLWVRTDTCDSDGYRLNLHWHEGDLYCGLWGYDDQPYDNVGVLALMMKKEYKSVSFFETLFMLLLRRF